MTLPCFELLDGGSHAAWHLTWHMHGVLRGAQAAILLAAAATSTSNMHAHYNTVAILAGASAHLCGHMCHTNVQHKVCMCAPPLHMTPHPPWYLPAGCLEGYGGSPSCAQCAVGTKSVASAGGYTCETCPTRSYNTAVGSTSCPSECAVWTSCSSCGLLYVSARAGSCKLVYMTSQVHPLHIMCGTLIQQVPRQRLAAGSWVGRVRTHYVVCMHTRQRRFIHRHSCYLLVPYWSACDHRLLLCAMLQAVIQGMAKH